MKVKPQLNFSAILLLALTSLWIGCGGGAVSTTTMPTPATPVITAAVPHIGHVALMVFENQQEDSILGNPNMPYLSQLAKDHAYAANYYADVHPSLGDYFMLTTGQVISNDLNFAGQVDVDNIVRELVKSGKTWKAYEESIPSAGYTGDLPYPYVKTHNPAAYFTDVQNNPAQASNLVGFDQLSADLTSGNLPAFMFIEPNQINTMHDCPGGGVNCTNDQRIAGGDAWAQNIIPTIINSPTFQNDGLLIITWDESWDSDSAHGGGHVLTMMIGPKVKTNYVSPQFYQHESLLRTICDAVGIASMGAATSAPPMSDFFAGN